MGLVFLHDVLIRHDPWSNLGHIHQIVKSPVAAIQTFALIRVIYDVLRQPLTNDKQPERSVARISDFMGRAAFWVADEISGFDWMRIAARACGSRAAQNIDRFVFAGMYMIFRAFVSGCDLKDIDPKRRQASSIPW